jgi:hypothetical protein
MPNKRSLKAKPESTEDLVRAYDEAACDAAWKWRKEKFDHSPETVELLEQMLDELHGELNRKTFKRRIGLGPSETDTTQWANLWGIYLGETLRARLGGTWILGHEEAPNLLAVEFPDGTVTFPTAKVYRRLSDGASENVVEYFKKVLREVEGAEGEGPTA